LWGDVSSSRMAISSTHSFCCCADADEGSFVNLQHKHNFTMAHFGMMLGMMCRTLEGVYLPEP